MIFIFEDSRESALSDLFCAGYDKDVADKFIYANGSGNLIRKIDELFVSKNFIEADEEICVFIDFIPDNRDTIHTALRIQHISKVKYRNRIIVAPLICAEYYFIKAMIDENIIIDKETAQICVDKSVKYKEFKPESGLDNNSFERFCKSVMRCAMKKCVNYYHGYYLRHSCDEDCEYSDSTCRKMSIEEKALKYLEKYPLVPTGTKYKKDLTVSREEMEERVRIQLNDIKELFDRLAESGYISYSVEIYRYLTGEDMKYVEHSDKKQR